MISPVACQVSVYVDPLQVLPEEFARVAWTVPGLVYPLPEVVNCPSRPSLPSSVTDPVAGISWTSVPSRWNHPYPSDPSCATLDPASRLLYATPSVSDDPSCGIEISDVVSSASPEPTFTRSETRSEIENDRNVALGAGPVPAGILGADVSNPALAGGTAGPSAP